MSHRVPAHTQAGLSQREKKRKRFVTPTKTNAHGDTLCFMVTTLATHKTTEALLNNGWRLVAVGGWRLVVGGWWRMVVVVGGGWRLWLVAVGGWWLVVLGSCP